MFKCEIGKCSSGVQVWVECKSNIGASATMLGEEGDIQVSARMDAAVFIVYLLQPLKLRSQKWVVDAAAQDHVYAHWMFRLGWLDPSPAQSMPCHLQVLVVLPRNRGSYELCQKTGDWTISLSLGERRALLCLSGCIVLPWRIVLS
jgi:hypothetical protein